MILLWYTVPVEGCGPRRTATPSLWHRSRTGVRAHVFHDMNALMSVPTTSIPSKPARNRRSRKTRIAAMGINGRNFTKMNGKAAITANAATSGIQDQRKSAEVAKAVTRTLAKKLSVYIFQPITHDRPPQPEHFTGRAGAERALAMSRIVSCAQCGHACMSCALT